MKIVIEQDTKILASTLKGYTSNLVDKVLCKHVLKFVLEGAIINGFSDDLLYQSIELNFLDDVNFKIIMDDRNNIIEVMSINEITKELEDFDEDYENNFGNIEE